MLKATLTPAPIVLGPETHYRDDLSETRECGRNVQQRVRKFFDDNNQVVRVQPYERYDAASKTWEPIDGAKPGLALRMFGTEKAPKLKIAKKDES